MNSELTIVNNELAIMPVMDIGLAIQRREQIVKFVQAIMVRDTDFGIIPGTDKPTLLKPGAEKLATFFGLTKRFQIVERLEDWTGHEHDGELFFYYLYRCGLYRGSVLIAEADGSCNSFEAKYRWRKAERICPTCGQANIRKSKQGGGWYCWQKLGGCGATFKAGNQAIESQEVGRIPNPDVADQVNTVQKMAQKRALIAATLLAVNASEFFTQDLEDYVDVEYTVTPEPKGQSTVKVESVAPEAPKPQAANGKPTNGNDEDKSKPYKFPNNAAKSFYNAVQEATGNYYDSPHHLLKVIDSWFNFASQDLCNEKMSVAVDHARAKQPEATGEQQELFDDAELDEAFPRGGGAAYQD